MADAKGSGGASCPGAIYALVLLTASATWAGGCGQTHRLETGYQYQPLSSSSVERRAFYADRYSVEARRAEAERQQSQRGMIPFQP